MAYVQSEAILTRVREVLEDSAGTLRTVPSGRFTGDLPEGLSESAEQRRALTAPRVAVSLTALSRSRFSPPSTGNFLLYDLAVEVRVIRLLTRDEQLDPALLTELQAAAAGDADVIRQALEYPGNLASTSGGEATDLVSGLLTFSGSRTRVRRQVNQGAQLLETIHSFTGKAKARPAV